MKKILLVLLISSFYFSAFAQDEISFSNTESYRNEFIHYKQDSFLIVHKTLTGSSDQMVSESTYAYLFKIKDETVDLLVSKEDDTFGYAEEIEVENTIVDYAQDYLNSLIYPDSEYDYMEGMLFEYYSSNNIKQIKENVLEVSYSYWSFEGGAHGNGWTHYGYYDWETSTHFSIEDVLTPEGFNFVYEEVKKDFFNSKENDQAEFLKDLDERTEGNRGLDDTQYYFDTEFLYVEIQMYQDLYGVDDFYIGYNNYSYGIPWADLKPFMIEGNPVEKMLSM